MKATLEIPDSLWHDAEAAARRAGLPLNDFLAKLLREQLAHRSASMRQDWPVPPPDVDKEETRRVQKLIDDEFGRIDLETWR